MEQKAVVCELDVELVGARLGMRPQAAEASVSIKMVADGARHADQEHLRRHTRTCLMPVSAQAACMALAKLGRKRGNADAGQLTRKGRIARAAATASLNPVVCSCGSTAVSSRACSDPAAWVRTLEMVKVNPGIQRAPLRPGSRQAGKHVLVCGNEGGNQQRASNRSGKSAARSEDNPKPKREFEARFAGPS